jgi:hypothetical protein
MDDGFACVDVKFRLQVRAAQYPFGRTGRPRFLAVTEIDVFNPGPGKLVQDS